MAKKERDFQPELIADIQRMYPEAIIGKVEFLQGIPDLLILHKNHWALLECKKSKDAVHQPNQDYYVDICNQMSFSRFVYPENKESVLHDLQIAFGT